MTITLTPDLERALQDRAKEQGTTPELLALETLRRHVLPTQAGIQSPAGETMADFLKGFIGIVNSGEVVPGGARMSEDCGRKFAEGLLEKRRLGKL